MFERIKKIFASNNDVGNGGDAVITPPRVPVAPYGKFDQIERLQSRQAVPELPTNSDELYFGTELGTLPVSVYGTPSWQTGNLPETGRYGGRPLSLAAGDRFVSPWPEASVQTGDRPRMQRFAGRQLTYIPGQDYKTLTGGY